MRFRLELPFAIKFVGFIGSYGVNLFFVLSGFLITRILLDTRDGAGYYRNFFARRTLRIFPLYYLAVAIYFVTNAEVREHIGWYVLYLENSLYSVEGRFSGADHFWSLCVEEQFYVLWPFFVRSLSDRWLKRAAVGLIVVSWALPPLMYAADAYNGLAVTVLLPFRMGGLLLGGILAIEEKRLQGDFSSWKRAGRRGLFTSMALWFSAVIVQSAGVDLGGGYLIQTLADVTWSFFVLTVLSAGDAAAHFEGPYLRSVGKYSYCMYVVHPSVIALAVGPLRFAPSQTGLFASLNWLLVFMVVVTASFAIAFLSWHIYEKQWLSLKRHFEYERAAAPGPSKGS